MPASAFFLLSMPPRRTYNTFMIRLFTALCKSFLKNLSEKVLFDNETSDFCFRSVDCSSCGAIGKFDSHGGYSRWLLAHEDGENIAFRIWVLRLKCASCEATHAILPDVLVPYSPYSLSFVLTVLIAYFERETTVEKICEKYGIAVSTLYRWKKLLAKHKDLMIGILKSKITPALEFLRNLFKSEKISVSLSDFFHYYLFSFMQCRSAPATRSQSP